MPIEAQVIENRFPSCVFVKLQAEEVDPSLESEQKSKVQKYQFFTGGTETDPV